MRPAYFLLFCITCITLFSCNYFDGEKTLPGITGRSGELLIVVEDKYWEDNTGDILLSVFAADVLGLPQPEPLFDAVNVKPAAFSNIFRTHRNIFMLNVDPGAEEKLEVRQDVWATPQVVVSLTVKDTARAHEILTTKSEKLTGYFLDKEKERNVNTYTKQKDRVLCESVKEAMGVNIAFPQSFTTSRKEKDFMWISQETRDLTLGILIYKFPYTDTETFTKEYIMDKRDEMTQKYIIGEVEGSYMKIYRDYPIPFEEISLNNLYAARINGLWNMEGDFMGGPFVTYELLNEAKNEVVLIDAFVFAPRMDKRNYIRQLESVISTIRF